jgi:hypothetical protein
MPIRLGTPPIEFNFFREQSGPASHLFIELRPETGTIIGGGAHVYKEDGSSSENLLTALYPQDDFPGDQKTWVARAKDHVHASPAEIEAWCVTAEIDRDAVYVGRAANATDSGVIQTWSHLPVEYRLVAGGARAFLEDSYAGALLLASSPLLSSGFGEAIGWYAAATDHIVKSPVVVEAYAIGINRDLLADHKLEVVFDSELGASANHPVAERTLERWITPDLDNGIVVGGGVEPRGPLGGNFLTSSWPITDWSKPIGWRGTSQDHVVPSPLALNVTAFAIVEQA